MSSKSNIPPPNTGDVLSRRFGGFTDDRPAAGAQPPQTVHTPHTVSAQPPAPGGGERRAEPAGMVRRTYYYSEAVADALAEAVARIHYGSRGRISKNAALDAIIAAGVEQLDAIEQRLNAT